MSVVRPETKGDETGIRRINDQAFGQKEEGELVDKLRNRGALTLSLVAVAGSQVVGHIAFSPVEIESKGSSFTAITLAPMAVLPGYQRKGIGSQLVRAGLEGCRRLGYELLFVLGHPDYYPRFGFVSAKQRGMDCEYEVPDEAWMVLELREGALAGKSGTVRFQPEFADAM